MGWAIGTGAGGRDIGYGVPAICDLPDCNEEIDRGVSFACGSFRNDNGCGLYFCSEHLYYAEDEYDDTAEFCDACCINIRLGSDNYKLHAATHDPKPDTLKWVLWKRYDQSWQQWRDETPKELKALDQRIAEAEPKEVSDLMDYLEPQMEQNQEDML